MLFEYSHYVFISPIIRTKYHVVSRDDASKRKGKNIISMMRRKKCCFIKNDVTWNFRRINRVNRSMALKSLSVSSRCIAR